MDVIVEQKLECKIYFSDSMGLADEGIKSIIEGLTDEGKEWIIKELVEAQLTASTV